LTERGLDLERLAHAFCRREAPKPLISDREGVFACETFRDLLER